MNSLLKNLVDVAIKYKKTVIYITVQLVVMHRYQIFQTDADTDTILAKNADTDSNTDTTVNIVFNIVELLTYQGYTITHIVILFTP